MNNLVTNNEITNFFNNITELLDNCESFCFNVAFINFSGIQLLLDSFKKLEEKNIKGKILTSTYLNFTQIKALEKIKKFKNIELKIYDCEVTNIGFHSKSYIFEFKDDYKILIGSSNITASAFKSNIEWNVKTVAKKDDIFLKDILNEFETLWKSSREVNDEFLTSYSNFLNSQNKKFKSFSLNQIKTNFMQEKALEKLENLRNKGENKALIIAATGTGKTYLSAFDVKNFKAKTILFLVHRENILIKAKQSFEEILPQINSFGLYTGNKKEQDKNYLFSTIQTMSSNFLEFSQDFFEYIIIDEAHHVTSPSYKKILDYFKPKFLLGLTATSNRMDGNSIYEVFDENIALDIRLNDALEHNLIVPFHYYGINDIQSIDYENVDLTKIDLLAKLLSVNKRVDFIIDKMNFYSNSGNKRKVLGFCVSKEHSNFMSEEFNKKGINSITLTSEDSISKREDSIKRLENENDSLEVIFTVDIFNEGIDIPSINMVLFLRPTNSPIVFVQQLGRGLRKYKNKEFLTVLDFIGNHKKAYLIALALVGNKMIDKESIKLSIENNFADLKNAFICMDEISKNRILEQINKENFNQLRYLKEQYFEVKNILGKVPTLVDFLQFEDVINPLKFIDESKSYIEFLAKVEENKELKELVSNEDFIKAIRFIENELPIKRVYEFVILKYLLNNDFCDENIAFKILNKYLNRVDKETIMHSFLYLRQDFLDSAQKNRYLKLINYENKIARKTKEFEELLKNENYKKIFEDSLNFGIYNYEEDFGSTDFGKPFLKLYSKYNMLNIAKLCNFPKIHSSFRGSGFLKYENDFFLFINLEKEKFSKSANYHNAFLSKDVFTYQSKPSHSSDKGDGERLCENKKFGVKLHIFVRKFVQVDKKTQDFIYLGVANTLKYWDNKPISLELKLENSLSDKLFEEFTKIIL
ncbi:DEAD/DEAH box helicase [Aliarcobacter butzleri]|uniref:DEAD/DEAH box helicase n=1 Tax=Aliarcobacter butzleri TaxID=28197 RepID=UPI00125F74C9|nr:DEAD/DEAH box helicase [Aliarcobacter butzleri]MCT7595003.1 DEAD/DEAH box helicase [Aliarcobacter butzleri]MCT7598193.1 DEAD/DEAH box helicase [Aliarcobacter butzleri]MCT7651954.1 DEAD/DEAH box helicase [Aliarcobacter butzleri]MDN5044101.1 DEAD/DEAH box helicase [Aliarcobacter butzleri]UXC29578.1 DEAD/DEAH box helicase [Aliarcobacter butzleri]